MQPSTYIPTWRRLAVEQRSSAFKRMQGTRIHSTPKSSRRTARIRITPGGETDCILRSVPRTGRTSSVRLFSCSTDGAVQHTIKGKGPDRSGPSRPSLNVGRDNNRIPVAVNPVRLPLLVLGLALLENPDNRTHLALY